MCGITGIAGIQDQVQGQRALLKMNNAIAHRGPDSDGFWIENAVALGHRRLSILDTSSRGEQPMRDLSHRYILVHNGEIYNFKEIRAEIDYPFSTGTDTELILAAWAKWGPDCIRRFAGMFAFAIYDKVEEKLFVVRDRLGIKPIYFHFNQGVLLFASEVRALLASDLFPKKINRHELGAFLCYQTVYGNGSLVEGVEMLPPGHYGIWEKGQFHIHTYWNIWENADAAAKQMSADEIRQEVRRRLNQAIERRMISDVPLGAFLSGGIDSSAIVALMAQASSQPIDTFSVVFEEKEFDESKWSGLISEKYKTKHHPILLKPADFLDALPMALSAMDHPSGDGINSYVVSGLTRKAGVKVALSGLGGDELFGGYPIFNQLPHIQQKSILKLPYPLRKVLAMLYSTVKSGRQAEKIKSLLEMPNASLDEVYKVFRTIYSWKELRSLLGSEYTQNHPLANILGDYSGIRRNLPKLSQIGGLEILSYTSNVLLRDTDQMSMAHALEVRVPFFDHDLVEFVMGIPDEIKKPSYPKRLLVESLGELLPHDLVHRQKMGFVFPWENWLRKELRDFCNQRIKSLDARGIIGKTGQLEKVWSQFQNGQGPWLWTHIWLPVVLEEWIQKNNIQA